MEVRKEEDDLQLADPMNMTAAGLFIKQSQPGSQLVCVSLSSKYFLLLPATQ